MSNISLMKQATIAAIRKSVLANFTTGDIFFVSSTSSSAANDGSHGRAPDFPYATVAYAIGRCTASNGDIIFVLPNHTETLTGAASVALNVAGVSIVGIGEGRARPTFNYTTAITASLDVTAANCALKNIVLTPINFGAITAAMNITAADFVMDGCEMVLSTGTNAPVLGILTAATAARLKILNSRFIGPATSTQTCTAAIKHEVGIDCLIRNNFIVGKLTQGLFNATAILCGLIDHNFFHIYTGTEAISTHASTTWFMTDNFMCVPSGTAPIISAAGSFAGNKYTTEGNGPTAGTALAI